ncbi:hypothetical protein BDZ45DRAFT_779702 [Acephala macrosclerotiorum]|nr:hypothetical protein BDZ45DRAFT_779702 [Acephala macrosclerotiorum]
MEKYIKAKKTPEELANGINLFLHPKKSLTEVENNLIILQEKVDVALSSSSKQRYTDMATSTYDLLWKAQSTIVQNEILSARVDKATKRRPIARRRLQLGGEVTASNMHILIEKRNKIREEKKTKRNQRFIESIARQERNELHEREIEARKGEKNKKRYLKTVFVDNENLSAAHLYHEIPDPETETKLATLEPMDLNKQLNRKQQVPIEPTS